MSDSERWKKGMRDKKQRKNAGGEWDDDLEVELIDLDTLEDTAESHPAKTVAPTWSVEPILRWQRSFTRKRWRTVSMLCMFALVCLVLVTNVRGVAGFFTNTRTALAARLIKQPPKLGERLPTPLTVTPSLTLPFADAGFSCVTSDAWSPTGRAIALLGYAAGCEYDSGKAVGLVTLYDAQTGKRLLRLSPDPLIKEKFYKQFPAIHDTLLFYYHEISWSPDKKHLAVLFYLHTSSQIGGAAFYGVLLFDQQQQNTRVVLQQQVNVGSYQLSANSYREWDTRNEAVIPTPSVENVDPFVFSSNIPFTEKYAWGDNGAFLPQPRKVASTTAIGNTKGDASFTLWQPGSVEVIKQDQSGGVYFEPGIFVWVTEFTTWSPDGRYLIDGIFLAALLEPPGYPRPNHKTLVAFHMENLPVLPIHDPSLLSALRILNVAQTAGVFYQMNISWSFNGRLMSITTNKSGQRMLYSAAHGYPSVNLIVPKGQGAQNPSSGYFAYSSIDWSPDSTRVLAQDPTLNGIAVWDIPMRLR